MTFREQMVEATLIWGTLVLSLPPILLLAFIARHESLPNFFPL